MRKKNILDLLIDDFIIDYRTKEDNFNSCIPNYNNCKEEYILPFIINNQTNYNLGFKFDINSSDELTKKKSIALYNLICNDFKELVSTMPKVFKDEEKNNGIESAISFMTNNVIIGNINKYKKNLKTIK